MTSARAARCGACVRRAPLELPRPSTPAGAYRGPGLAAAVTWWQWALLLGLGGPLLMLACAFLALGLFFFLEPPPRVPDLSRPSPDVLPGATLYGDHLPRLYDRGDDRDEGGDASVSWWLHVLVLYPLAILGLGVVVGLVYLVMEPLPSHDQHRYCAGCGREGSHTRRSLQGNTLCDTCAERLTAEVRE